MMDVYVVNLDARTDRLQHISNELHRVGVPFQRVPAVDAQNAPQINALADRGPGLSGHVISNGALACLLSHRITWQMLLDSDAPYCAVLEDDVLLAESFAAFMTPDWIPADAAVVKLETFLNRTHIDANMHIRLAGHDICRLRGRHVGGAAYIVSRNAAESLLERSAPGVDAADEILFNPEYGWFSAAKVYQAVPAIAVQADRLPKSANVTRAWMESSIPQRDARGDTIKRETPLARLYRRVRNEITAKTTKTKYTIVAFGG